MVAPDAQATQRTVYFNQSAVATSAIGFNQDVNAKCRIVLTNPSTADQKVTLTVYASAASTGSAPGDASPPAGFSTIAVNGVNGFKISNVALIQNGSPVTYDFTYPAYTKGITGDQQLTCRGSIVAEDSSSTSPGFMVASAVILTFTESSISQTQGATSATTGFGGVAIFSQIPISINRGKPF